MFEFVMLFFQDSTYTTEVYLHKEIQKMCSIHNQGIEIF